MNASYTTPPSPVVVKHLGSIRVHRDSLVSLIGSLLRLQHQNQITHDHLTSRYGRFSYHQLRQYTW